jgi:hypothetical protein
VHARDDSGVSSLGFHPPLTYAVPVTFALWTAIVLTTGLGAALLLMPNAALHRQQPHLDRVTIRSSGNP